MTLENKVESVFRRIKTRLSSTVKRSNSVEQLNNNEEFSKNQQKRKRGTSLRIRRSLRKNEQNFDARKVESVTDVFSETNNIVLNPMVCFFIPVVF